MPTSTVRHLVVTGGPSAGKTTAMAYLVEKLSARGWRVFLVPEAATLVISGGVADMGLLATGDRDAFVATQRAITGIQLDLRRHFEQLAAAFGPRTVVLHDRGVADNAAYLTGAEYQQVIGEYGLSPASVHHLYDAVLHLRSAAVARTGYDGSGYTTENNPARRETAAQAAELDEATLAGWTGHSHLTVIASGSSFAAKLERTLAAVLGVLGDPEPVEIERKFALSCPPDLTHPVLAAAPVADIEQVYLPGSDRGTEQRARARTLAGVTTYTHARKTDAGGGTRVEVETSIDADAYRLLAGLRDPGTAVLRKQRYLFVDGDLRFELDHILAPVDRWLLEVELVHPGDEVVLPAFLPGCVEVTGDPAWRNRQIAASA